jgi:hypothetical protein
MRYMDVGMRNWIIKTARDNLWRVSGFYELEDLISDGYLCYCKCRARYNQFFSINHPTRDESKQFMALVMASFTNHIHSLARKRVPEIAEADLVNPDGEALTLEGISPTVPEEATLHVHLATLPEPAVAVIRELASNESGMYKRERQNGSRRKYRETTPEYLQRVLAIDPDIAWGELAFD